jgi:leucyl aminopeptidase
MSAMNLRSMKISLYTNDLFDAPVDFLGILAFEDEPDRGLLFAQVNRTLGGALEQAARDERFEGKVGQSLVFNNSTGVIKARRVMVFGAGPKAGYGPHIARTFTGLVARKAMQVQAKKVAVQLVVPDGPSDPARVLDVIKSYGEGAVLGAYRFDLYRTREPVPASLEEVLVAFVAEDVIGLTGAQLRSSLLEGRTFGEAATVARTLVDEPPNVLNPDTFAERARRLAKDHHLACRVLGPRELERQGMELLLGVCRGSAFDPRLVHLTYTPEASKTRGRRPVIALVGKGLTFDAGGLSLKTNEGMVDMKIDMGGAASVLGAMLAIADLKPDCEVHGMMGIAENMPDGRAIRPGDVIKSKAGTTVEIMNTDAEGRLVLADVLAYAQDQGVTDIIDVATLTGACVVALGPLTAGAFVNDEAMALDMQKAWSISGERFWRMPLEQDLRKQLESRVADLKNVGDRYGGAITAALFLETFIEKGKVRWAHLDVAGPVYASEERNLYGRGGTGFGVRTLIEYVKLRGAQVLEDPDTGASS